MKVMLNLSGSRWNRQFNFRIHIESLREILLAYSSGIHIVIFRRWRKRVKCRNLDPIGAYRNTTPIRQTILAVHDLD